MNIINLKQLKKEVIWSQFLSNYFWETEFWEQTTTQSREEESGKINWKLTLGICSIEIKVQIGGSEGHQLVELSVSKNLYIQIGYIAKKVIRAAIGIHGIHLV